MNIVFWNNSNSGTGAATSNLICMAATIAHEKCKKSVLTQIQFDYSDLESGIIAGDHQVLREGAVYFEQTGIDAVMRKMKFGNRTGSYEECFIQIDPYIKFLPPTARSSMKMYEEDMIHSMIKVLDICSRDSHFTFIDIPSGKSGLNLRLIKESDVVVVNLSQNSKMLNSLILDTPSLYEKCLFVIGNYSAYSQNSLWNICHKLGLKREDIGIIPFNMEYMDAISEGKAVDFIVENLNCAKYDDNYEFIVHVKRTSRMLLEKMLKKPN